MITLRLMRFYSYLNALFTIERYVAPMKFAVFSVICVVLAFPAHATDQAEAHRISQLERYCPAILKQQKVPDSVRRHELKLVGRRIGFTFGREVSADIRDTQIGMTVTGRLEYVHFHGANIVYEVLFPAAAHPKRIYLLNALSLEKVNGLRSILDVPQRRQRVPRGEPVLNTETFLDAEPVLEKLGTGS